MLCKKSATSSVEELKVLISAAKGEQKADIVIKGAKFLDVFAGEFVPGDVAISGKFIVGVKDSYEGHDVIDGKGLFVVPGFIDAHVHIESSLMTPESFQKAVLPCGTTTVVWDPHEITNVQGTKAISWALESSEGLMLDVFVMLPSCVPSTSPEFELETSGATLGVKDLIPFMNRERVLGLAEMMNFPGVLFKNQDVMEKLQAFVDLKKDGHAPGLTGKELNAYCSAGINSCHESTILEEAKEKLLKGLFPLIREGSCAKDANALIPLINSYTSDHLAFCSDDRNPADIEHEGHINHIVNMALKAGTKPEDVFRTASLGASKIFGFEDRGVIAPGYLADICLVKFKKAASWKSGIDVVSVIKKGKVITKDIVSHSTASNTSKEKKDDKKVSNFNIAALNASMFQVTARDKNQKNVKVKVIGVRPGQIITDSLTMNLPIKSGLVDIEEQSQVQKMSVIERHHGTGRFSVGFVKGFNLKDAAIATSINHDSHNVIVVGTEDDLMYRSVKRLQEINGGIVILAKDGTKEELALPIGGLMTDESPEKVAKKIRALKEVARKVGCMLDEPFLQLSFLALPVIPSLKLTDRGLVDATIFKVVSVFDN